MLKELYNISELRLEFSGRNNLCVDYILTENNGFNYYEKIICEIGADGCFKFVKYIPDFANKEPVDPDKLIKTTFSKGLTYEQRVQKDNTYLPFFEKQVNSEITKNEFSEKDLEQDDSDDLDV